MRRLLIAIPTIFVISFVMFTLLDLAPGDPLEAMVNPQQGGLPPQVLTYYRHRFGLDKPFMIRYFCWLKEVLHGDFGISTTTFRPVSENLFPRLKNTLILCGASLSLGAMLGIFIGFISAVWKYSLLDYVVTVWSFSTLSTPIFFTGFLFLYFFAHLWPVLPGSGIHTVGSAHPTIDIIRHLILPVLSLSTAEIATFTRYMRAGLLHELSNDYVRTAAAKGLSYIQVVVRHTLRNGITSVVTLLGFRLQVLVGGAIVIETVFNWPGMGSMFLEAIHGRDYPSIMGYTLIFATAIVVSNLLVDIAYVFIDPRVKYA